MDLKSFLASGLIEAYVLGQCSADERATVERMAAQYPEVRAEIVAVETALEQYAQAQAVAPPAWMKGRIQELVERESPRAGRRNGLRRYWMPALAAASLGLLAAVTWLMIRNQDLTQQTTLLQQQAADCAAREESARALQQQVAFLRNPDTRQITLKDSVNTALAYLNTGTCEVAIDLTTLPAPRGATYFQFWAIVDGQPKSMGMINRDSGADWQRFPCVQGAVAYAVSEENNPQGNATPTTVRLVGAVEG
ncbi:MAG: anti-sigma factor [Saprospiraceae bacterium]